MSRTVSLFQHRVTLPCHCSSKDARPPKVVLRWSTTTPRRLRNSRACRGEALSKSELRATRTAMPTRVLVKDNPHRTLALTTDDYALVFRHTHSADSSLSTSSTSLPLPNGSRQPSSPRCMVEFAASASLDFTGYRTLGTAQGALGLITLNNDVFLCTVTGATQVATPRPGETVQKIHTVEFCKSFYMIL